MYATVSDRDVVWLPADVRLDDTGLALVEPDRDQRHELNAAASVVLGRVAETGRVSVADLARALTSSFDVDPATAVADVKRLVTELNSKALINLDGSLRARLTPSWVRGEFWALMAGTAPTLPTVRTSASVSRLIAAMLSRLAAPLALGVLLVLTVMSVGVAKFGAPNPSDILAVSAPLVVLLFFATSTVAHEVAHLLMVRVTRGRALQRRRGSGLSPGGLPAARRFVASRGRRRPARGPDDSGCDDGDGSVGVRECRGRSYVTGAAGCHGGTPASLEPAPLVHGRPANLGALMTSRPGTEGIVLRDVVVRRGTFQLPRVSAFLVPGTTTHVIGANGSGKSSLLFALLGFIRPTEGEISVLGQRPHRRDRRFSRLVGYVPDSQDEVIEELSGAEFLNLQRRLRSASSAERSRWAGDASRLAFDLALDALPARIATYSHGMRKKLQIISALQFDPTVLIADEPFNGLDAEARATVEQLLASHVERGGLVVTAIHDSDFTQRTADQVVSLDRHAAISSLRRGGATDA